MSEAFEALRQRANADVADTATTRRPTWAPPLKLSGELLDLVRELGWLPADEPPVARLWGEFMDPKRYGATCTGFKLIAGTKRNGRCLFYAQRGRLVEASVFRGCRQCILHCGTAGEWRFGPHYKMIETKRIEDPRTIKNAPGALKHLTKHRREMEEFYSPHYNFDARRAKIIADCAEAEAREAIRLPAALKNLAQRERVTELAGQRVAEFAGDPDLQMMIGGKLACACAVCGRALTDAISLERGIGPECWGSGSLFAQARFADALASIRITSLVT